MPEMTLTTTSKLSPFQQCIVHFYKALGEDATARAQHVLSHTRLTRLRLAESHFSSALTIISSVDITNINALSPQHDLSQDPRRHLRFTTHLSDLNLMLSNHIASTRMCIDATEEVQASRQKRLESNASSHGRTEEVQARLARLKLRGFEMARFDPRRVREVCEVALAEL